MILDANLRFSNGQSITSTADSSNIIDTKIALRDAGTGRPLYVVLTVSTALTNTGTVDVSLQGDSSETMTPDASRILFRIPAATAAGTVFVAELQPGGVVEQFRYLGLIYTVNGTVSTGNAKAFITQDYQRWVVKANNYTIS